MLMRVDELVQDHVVEPQKALGLQRKIHQQKRLQAKEAEKLRKLLLLLLQQLLKKRKKQQVKNLLKRLRKQKRPRKKLLKMEKRLLQKRRRRKRKKRLLQLKMGSKTLLLSLRKKKRVMEKPLMMAKPRRSEDPCLLANHSSLPWALRTSLMDFLLTPTSFITTYDLYCSSSCSTKTATAAVRSSSETKKKNKKSCTLSTFFAASFHSFFSYPFPTFPYNISNIASIILVSITEKKNTGPPKTATFLCLSLQNLKS